MSSVFGKIFTREKEFYTRDLNPARNYIKQAAHYVHRILNIPLEEAVKRVKKNARKRFKDPIVTHSTRGENGDRVLQTSELSRYIDYVDKGGFILAPTGTVYLNEGMKKSIHADYMKINKKERSRYKKMAQKAKAAGNNVLRILGDLLQKAKKIINNSLSGTYGKKSGVLSNPTSHSTLTSVTRTITSIANASNEKMIYGNRYYPTPTETLNNVVYIVSNCRVLELREAISRYKIYVPTVEDIVRVLKYSGDLYWKDSQYYRERIIPYLETCTEEERCAIVYLGDLYHLHQFNRELIQPFLDELSTPVKVSEDDPSVDPSVLFSDSDIQSLTHCLHYSAVKGRGKDYDKMKAVPGLVTSLVHTKEKVDTTLEKYRQLIQVFFCQNTLPGQINKLKTMARRTIVLSDTDSTCFALDNWVVDKYKRFYVNDETIAYASAVGFVATQVIAHYILVFSKNMNVHDDNLGILAMKNEFFWLTHLPSEVSKHYAALTAIVEGNVYGETELEIKGVHLKNSAVPIHLIKHCHTLIKRTLERAAEGVEMNLAEILFECIRIENELELTLTSKEAYTLLKQMQIKDADSYALGPDRSPYQHYTFWQEVFAPSYAECEPPPYQGYKIPLTIKSKTDFTAWTESLPTPVSQRLFIWMEKNGKSIVKSTYLPEGPVVTFGIPSEILPVVDITRIILDLTKQHRIFLESLGLILTPKVLIRDQFSHNVC